MSGLLRLRTRHFEIFSRLFDPKWPEKSRFSSISLKTGAGANNWAENQGICPFHCLKQQFMKLDLGHLARKVAFSGKKPNLTAVKGQFDRLNCSTVRLHNNLEYYPGLTQLRFGPLLAKLVVDLCGIPHEQVNIEVFSVFTCY